MRRNVRRSDNNDGRGKWIHLLSSSLAFAASVMNLITKIWK
jgi:hypothetical protein